MTLRAQVSDLLDEKLMDVENHIAELQALQASLRKRRRLAVVARSAPPCGWRRR